MDMKRIRSLFFMNAQKYDYDVETSRVTDVAIAFADNYKKTHDLYCPFYKKQSEATICPCRDMRECGHCKAGLYKGNR